MSDLEEQNLGTKVVPGRQEPAAISADALLAKSKLYAHRALKAKSCDEDEIYQIWAALALELLAKASLAAIHPCLVVDPVNPNSLLEACGINTDTKVKTVDAHVVYARLKHTVPKFGTPNAEACLRISQRRNAELHSGLAAFAGIQADAWEGEFWSTAQLILASMELELEDWVGKDSKIPIELARHFHGIKQQAARQRIADAEQQFEKTDGKKRSKKEKDTLREQSKSLDWYSHRDHFRYFLDHYWDQICPACECKGFMGGDRVDEQVIDQDLRSGYEIVAEYYSPMEFYCPTCELHLEGTEELEVANLEQEYEEKDEREIEYEPEYGND